MVNLIINNKKISVPEETTILEAAKQNNILIPNLCYLENIHKIGSCRICVVEVEGMRNLQASCMVTVREGMKVYTNSERVKKTRNVLFELMLSDHPKDCLKCERNQKCELQKLGEQIQIKEARFEGQKSQEVMDISSPSIIRDTSKCILCRRCVTVCNEIQGVGALNPQKRGFKTQIGPAMALSLNSVNCAFCGQCTVVCPVGALVEKDATQNVWKALFDKNKRVIVQTAPAIRAALGEEFGYEPGTLVTGKMVSALRQLAFDDVFDTNFTADLTIIEEGNEFLQRVTKALTGEGATLPMITSCSPGWIKFVEHSFPEKLEHLSSCKSPHMMLGALAKSYYAEKLGMNPKDIFVVSIMPCTAKKYEIVRPEMINDGFHNVDAVLTTRELALMIKKAGIDFQALEEDSFDNPLGLSTGAADIFAVTGGVMEAALRTVYEIITGRELPFAKLHITPLVGFEQIKTAEITIKDPKEEFKFLEDFTVKIAVTSGLKGAKYLMDQIVRGESPYHFIEVMGCPGGCISGGGQPRPTTPEIRLKRLQAIYNEDESKAIRKSHENPFVETLYQDYLNEPLGHKSHELLHTHYTKRGKFNELLDE
ncbi:MAG: ferredoxin [Clostridiaceae bacterium BRH_c20a]|nr:MAG: ferredoxin [Clostridiaceae bacterium BRH_c20a]